MRLPVPPPAPPRPLKPAHARAPACYACAESYAGHYVPAISHRILKNNQNLTQGEVKINMKGLAIGNGLVNPKVQYTQCACEAVLRPRGSGGPA